VNGVEPLTPCEEAQVIDSAIRQKPQTRDSARPRYTARYTDAVQLKKSISYFPKSFMLPCHKIASVIRQPHILTPLCPNCAAASRVDSQHPTYSAACGNMNSRGGLGHRPWVHTALRLGRMPEARRNESFCKEQYVVLMSIRVCDKCSNASASIAPGIFITQTPCSLSATAARATSPRGRRELPQDL